MFKVDYVTTIHNLVNETDGIDVYACFESNVGYSVRVIKVKMKKKDTYTLRNWGSDDIMESLVIKAKNFSDAKWDSFKTYVESDIFDIGETYFQPFFNDVKFLVKSEVAL